MGKYMTAKEILESYDEISDIRQIDENAIFLNLYEKQFLLFLPSEGDPTSRAEILLYNDEFLDYPHIMYREYSFEKVKLIPEGTYRLVCLYEQESIVNSIVSYENKIFDCIDRLIELLSMNQVEKEREFKKEFMFYWNSQSDVNNCYTVYLQNDNQFAELDVYFGKKNIRLIERGLTLSDLDKRERDDRLWLLHVENEAFYIPVKDTRGILPQHRGYKWTAKDVQNVVYGKQIEHIDDETFQMLETHIPLRQNLVLVFGMKTEQSSITFALNVKCRNGAGHTLLEKIIFDIIDVEPLHTERKDYLYLCNQIGNDMGLMHKRVLLAGVGSLGSYVAFELVKNGATKVDVYDGDNLEEENILRWAYGGIGKGTKKATTIQMLLNLLHPEIKIEAHDKYLDADTLTGRLSDVDLVIFTVGKSDEQLMFNRALKKAGCNIPVIYAWLEEGGNFSHILYVDYQHPGCFECLYTDTIGNPVNNRARKNSEDETKESIIRNGCGGTRAAYGTATLLRTTAALLDIIRDIENHKLRHSTLFDVTPNSTVISDTNLQTEACNCCGCKE